MQTLSIKKLTFIHVLSALLFLGLTVDTAAGFNWECKQCGHRNQDSELHCSHCRMDKGAVGGGHASGSTGAMVTAGAHGSASGMSGITGNAMIVPAMGSSSKDFLKHIIDNDPELRQLIDSFNSGRQNRASAQPVLPSTATTIYRIVTGIIGAVAGEIYRAFTISRELQVMISALSNPAYYLSFQSLVLNLNQLQNFSFFENHQTSIQVGTNVFYDQNPEVHSALLLNDPLKAFRAIWQAVLQYNLLLMSLPPGLINHQLLSVFVQLQLNQDLISSQAALDLLQNNIPDSNAQLGILVFRRIVRSMSNIQLVQELSCEDVDSLENLLEILRTALTNPQHNQTYPYLFQVSFFAYYSSSYGVQSAALLPVYIIWFRGQYRIQVGSYISPRLKNLEELDKILRHIYKASVQQRNQLYGEIGIPPVSEASLPIAQVCDGSAVDPEGFVDKKSADDPPLEFDEDDD